jgi:hypothetical protein
VWHSLVDVTTNKFATLPTEIKKSQDEEYEAFMPSACNEAD